MVITLSRVWIDRGMIANPGGGQLNRRNIFPCPRSRLRIWSRETGSTVPSRARWLILHQEESDACSRVSLLIALYGGVYLCHHLPPGQCSMVDCHSSIDGVHQGSLITSDFYSGKAPRINERPRLVSHKHYWYIMDILYTIKNSIGGFMVDCRHGRSYYRETFQLRT